MKPVCLPEKYEILGELGAGGMGLVYHARDRVLDREVALKVLSEQVAADPVFVQRFLTEARTAASLNHPQIVQIYEFGETGNGHFLAMELVDGESLKTQLQRIGRFTEAESLDLVLQACQALAVAHEAGIVHRDVKPANMMLTQRGEFKLVDLGLAKCLHDDDGHTQTGQSLGTPHFISPEQIKGARVIDGRADIYSLGATMYFLATGSAPFQGSSGAHVMARHLNDPLPDPRAIVPQLSDGFCQIVGRMMAKEPDDRYQDMEAVASDLRVLRGGGRLEDSAAVPSGVDETVFMPSLQRPAMVWPEQSLDRVTRRLAEYVGPLARVLVRQAVGRAQNWEDLGLELAAHVRDRGDRATFLAACEKIASGGGTTTVDTTTASAAAMSQVIEGDSQTLPLRGTDTPAFSLDEAEVIRVVALLADRIGPVARMLVQRELKRAKNSAELIAGLARAIPDQRDRRSFREAMGQTD